MDLVGLSRYKLCSLNYLFNSKRNNCGKYRPNTNGMYADVFQIDEILKKQVMHVFSSVKT